MPDELAARSLVRPFGIELDMGKLTYYLEPRQKKRRAEVRRFGDWLASVGTSAPTPAKPRRR